MIPSATPAVVAAGMCDVVHDTLSAFFVGHRCPEVSVMHLLVVGAVASRSAGRGAAAPDGQRLDTCF
jgi:hypothetical protein